MKKPLLITSEYIKDEAGENMVKAALKPLIPHFDICMTTHSPMSKEIQSIVKYYVYDHRNEFVDPKLELDIWSDCPSFYFTFPQYMPPIHSYAVYRAYMNAVSLMKDYYEDFTYLESDCVLTEEDVERLKDLKKICERENKEALFFKNPNSSTSLLFFYCKMSFFEEIFPKLKNILIIVKK
jgi:hypothetical protein